MTSVEGRMGREAPERGWQRDAAAFTGLVRRWQQPVARFLLRVVGDGDRVQDLCQEVFLRVFQARDRYQESEAFSTWLFQIALNVGRDALRRQRPWQSLSEHEPLVRESPTESCEQRELSDVMAAALAELPPRLREVVALRHDQDMNFEQMARVLGTPASTLKSRFAVAMSRLRERLNALGISQPG